jgi:hypothetical protein
MNSVEVLKQFMQDFLDTLTKLFLALALICGWLANFTLKGY